MKNLHILNDDIIPISVDLITQLLTSEEAQKQFFAAIYHQGRVSEAANRQSDLELAGTVVSAIVESELVAFLKRENSKRGAKKNYRNGYIPRELHVGKEKLRCRSLATGTASSGRHLFIPIQGNSDLQLKTFCLSP